ncbi:MAG: ATP-binding protein [Bacteroidota bacterium]
MLLAVGYCSSCQRTGKKPAIDPWAAYRKAYNLLSTNRDSAFLYFNRLAENSKDRQQVALAYYNMALIQSYAGDHYGAQESLTISLNSLDENRAGDRNYLATDFNELAMTSFNLQEYATSLIYCQKALGLTDDPALLQYIFTNQGNANQKLGKYEEALTSYRQVIKLSDRKGTVYAMALTSLATTKWLKDSKYNAAPDLHAALAIRLRQKDTWGLNSSYAHLADFYGKKNTDSALFYARKMLVVATRLQSPDDRLEATQKMILFTHTAEIKNLYLQYQALNDSITAVHRAAKNQFALIRYGVEKNKAENLVLQKANTEKKYQLGFVLLFTVCAATFAFFWYRKRKWQQELDKQNAIIETRQKDSKKVHDTLANDIYRIMKRIQHDPAVDRSWLEDNIDEVYQRARDLSYEINTDPDEYFTEKIDDLLTGFANEETAVVLVGNEKEFWQKLPAASKPELKYVLQELMVNMQKHSRAGNVLVRFTQQEGTCLITYVDDGIGLKDGHVPKNGLKNTGNRINTIGGEIKFVSSAGKGLEIQIAITVV